jgi:hypothetical protein
MTFDIGISLTADQRSMNASSRSLPLATHFAREYAMPDPIASVRPHSPTVETRLTYIGAMTERPRYYSIGSSRDVIARDRRTIQIEDARSRAQPPSLAREGFALFPHKSAVSDFCDPQELARIYLPEMKQLVTEISRADQVVICDPFVHRFNNWLPDSSGLQILRPARFVHVDVSDSTAAVFTEQCRPKSDSRSVRRFAHYNLWRVFSPPPQDIPLAVCDSSSVSRSDLIDADSISDIPGKPESSTVVVLVRYSPRHRWSYFRNMNRQEVLLFKSHDSDPSQPHHVPHSAFKDPTCPLGVAPRASIEVRAIAFWFESD